MTTKPAAFVSRAFASIIFIDTVKTQLNTLQNRGHIILVLLRTLGDGSHPYGLCSFTQGHRLNVRNTASSSPGSSRQHRRARGPSGAVSFAYMPLNYFAGAYLTDPV